MSNFTLPPPPPPPPKAAPDADFFSYQQGQSGRGDRGYSRGRGSSSNFRGSTRSGGFSNPNALPSYQRNSQEYRGGRSSHVATQNYHNQRNSGAAALSGSNTQTLSGGYRGNSSSSLDATSGGHDSFKRQREQNYLPQNSFQPKSRQVHKPKVDVAPAVPSFGFSLPLLAPGSITSPSGSAEMPYAKAEKQKAKRKSNQLGLTPQCDTLEESEDEDVDEEVAFAAYGGPLRVEYNGVVTELGSTESLRQWREDRKSKFPTKARIEEKAKQALKQKQEALRERLVLEQEQKRDLEERVKGHEERRRKEKEMAVEKDAKHSKALEKHLAKAIKLQKKLGIKPSGSDHISSALPILTEKADNSVEMNMIDAGQDTPPNPPEQSKDGTSHNNVVSPHSDSEVSSSESDESSTSDSSSSNEAPEEATSKVDGPVRVPPPKRVSIQRQCQEFLMRGQCRRRASCRFKHDTPGRGTKRRVDLQKQAVSTKRKTLHERLVEQEQETENRLALQAVKYLGQHGFLDGGA